MELHVTKGKAPISTIAFYYAQAAKAKIKLFEDDTAEPHLVIPDASPVDGDVAIAKHLATSLNLAIYPEELRGQIDPFLEDYPKYNMHSLEVYLTYRTFIIGHAITLADLAVFGSIKALPPNFVHLKRWKNTILAEPFVKRYENTVNPGGKGQGEQKAAKQARQVCTRFAPEPSGFLHIGHAKAALASEDYSRSHKGKFLLRFDNTNPKNETIEFEEKIKEDVALLDIKYDLIEHTSDYSEKIMEHIETLLKTGKAFCDDTPWEQIKEFRMSLQPSPNRDNSIEKNLELWQEMLKGTEKGRTCVARAKIDYASQNGTLRDPVIARCVDVTNDEHPNKTPVFPTYDIACPIVDSEAGVTHAMRSWEYQDRNAQYQWFIKTLNLNPVEIISFSRLSFNYTVLGKRHLRRLVQNGKATGWDDPRFPTVRGLRRRGLQPQALREFCKEQGASRNQNLNDWDKLWAMNRDLIAKTCPRVMSVSEEEKVVLELTNVEPGTIDAPIVPNMPAKGTRQLPVGPHLWIPDEDAKTLEVGKKVTLLHWGNIIIDEIKKDGEKIVEAKGHGTFEDKNFKNTPKLNWIVPDKSVKIVMREWNHLLKVKAMDPNNPNEDILDLISDVPFEDTVIYCDPSIASATKGSIYQLERRSEIIVDELASGDKPAMTFLIPTGKVKPIGLPIKIQLFHAPEEEQKAK